MSALGGIFARDGAPADREVLAGISASLRQMGPDGEWRVELPSVSLLFRPFHTDSQSRADRAPILVRDGYAVTLDGRIDNLPEIAASLGEALAGLRAVDAALGAYQRWGVTGLGRLVGDFALCIRDPREDYVVLAIDGLGRRPLFYHASPSRVCWASASRALVDTLCLSAELDDEYVADFLANRVSAASPFRAVGVLLGGHALVAGRSGERLVRYWAPDPDKRIHYQSDREYEEHFAVVFGQAVACRADSDRPVVCELSGGLDSSSIACVAAGALRQGRVDTPGLHTFSYVFPGSATADETPFVRLAEGALGRPGLHITDEEAPQLRPLPAGLRPDFPSAGLGFQARHERVADEMRRLGARVLLSGVGGDQVLWSSPEPGLPISDLLSEGRFSKALSVTSAWSRALGLPFSSTLWKGGVFPLLPHAWQSRLQRAIPPGEWFAPAFTRRMDFSARMLPLPDDVGFRRPSTARQYGFVRRAMRLFALERAVSDGYVDFRYPYLDRRLVEFALAIPVEQMVRPRESRSIVRRALLGAVPRELLERRSKAGPEESFHRALQREWPRISAMAADSRVAALGYVDGDAFLRALQRARHGLVENQVQLSKTLGLEFWLHTLDAPTAPRELRHAATAVDADGVLQHA